MGKRDYFKHGDYNVICDRCGIKFKASECQMEWDNLYVCYHCWEIRQPQDFVRGIYDDQTVPIARPRGEDRFITTPVTPEDL
jgi:hypothetical protein